ncbi:MAG: radical SAM protein, partial [Desulfurococcaceae archaeon]
SLISKLMQEYLLNEYREFIGVEVGIETGSPTLARKIMIAKSLPYSPEQWPSIVEDAFKIMHDNRIIPAATVILGLPEETADDVLKTVELIERLKPYRSIIVPMFFVPMGVFKKNKWFLRDHITQEHIMALKVMYDHTIYWAENIMRFYMRNPMYLPIKFLLKYFIKFVKRRVDKYIVKLEEIVKK